MAGFRRLPFVTAFFCVPMATSAFHAASTSFPGKITGPPGGPGAVHTGLVYHRAAAQFKKNRGKEFGGQPVKSGPHVSSGRESSSRTQSSTWTTRNSRSPERMTTRSMPALMMTRRHMEQEVASWSSSPFLASRPAR